MSQQEFEPRQHQSDEEQYQPQYPYAWSEQNQWEGMPRDEPPGSYRAQDGQYEASNAAQVPWWARPQPQRSSPLAFAGIVLVVILFACVLGGLGILGVILGSIGYILGIILGAVFALFIFFLLLVFLILALIGRVIRRAFGPSWGADRSVARRAARRSWRGW
ncbi:MAG: hypothetical protein ACRDHW_12020 [Ktedonobacteraceae bacterium]